MASKNGSVLHRLSTPLLEAIESGGLSADQIKAAIESLIGEGHQELFESLKLTSPEMLAEERELRVGFEDRNYRRWKEPFDLLAMLLRMCSEIGEAHSHGGPSSGDPLVFDMLASLHPRGLLVSNEIQCLMRGSFADAALARWRTLHELTVVAMFIVKHGHYAALCYRLSFEFARERAAKQYNEYSERANLSRFSDADISEMSQASEEAAKELGCRLKGDWGWAAGFLASDRPTLYDLECDVGMDHWRPRVRWASQNTHAGYRELMGTLGMSEAKEFVFQVGPSNSGLVDPLHMTAISQMNLTISFLFFPEPNFDRLLMSKVAQVIVDEIGETALVSNCQTADDLDEPR